MYVHVPVCSVSQQEDLDAARKKTDEVTPDDQPDSGEKDVGPDGDNKTKTKKSKAALEAEVSSECFGDN